MKRRAVIGGAVLLVTAVAVVLLVRDSNPHPSRANDAGSTEQGLRDIAAANNRFAFDLYSQLGESDEGNLFFSPYSVSVALAMLYEGADGATADEIRSVLHLSEGDDYRPNLAAIHNRLNEGRGDYDLATGNALWAQLGFPFSVEYLTTIADYYGGKATEVDFEGDLETSRQTINEYIAEQTRGRIEELFAPDVLSAATRLVLTNAICFKGTWVREFDPKDTQEREFHVSPTETVMAPMMTIPDREEFNVAFLPNMQVLELPYEGDRLSMLLILPSEDLASIESDLTGKGLAKIRGAMEQTELDEVSIPRFEMETDYTLNETLAQLGMPTAFSDKADFSGMTGSKGLALDVVVHKAFVKVDEKGTEAAAATGGAVAVSAGPTFVADRPFLFLIQERESGSILFMGRVVDPTK